MRLDVRLEDAPSIRAWIQGKWCAASSARLRERGHVNLFTTTFHETCPTICYAHVAMDAPSRTSHRAFCMASP